MQTVSQEPPPGPPPLEFESTVRVAAAVSTEPTEFVNTAASRCDFLAEATSAAFLIVAQHVIPAVANRWVRGLATWPPTPKHRAADDSVLRAEVVASP